MKYLEIPNWDEFQHYKDRNPPWIKLHNQILENYEFTCLPDATKAHLLCIWMLASRTDNKIPNNPQWIANKIGASDLVQIDLLVEANFLAYTDASTMLADCSGDRTVGVPLEEERRGEKRIADSPKRAIFTPPDMDTVKEYFQGKGSPATEAERFFYFYDSKHWMVGKNKMKKWESAAGGWISRNKEEPNNKQFNMADDFP